MKKISRLKNGVCECKILKNRIILPSKSINLCYEGYVDENRLRREIIPDIKDHLKRGWSGKFPMLIYSYYSVPNSEISVIIGKRGPRFESARPKRGTKSYDWLITEDEKTIRIDSINIAIK